MLANAREDKKSTRQLADTIADEVCLSLTLITPLLTICTGQSCCCRSSGQRSSSCEFPWPLISSHHWFMQTAMQAELSKAEKDKDLARKQADASAEEVRPSAWSS